MPATNDECSNDTVLKPNLNVLGKVRNHDGYRCEMDQSGGCESGFGNERGQSTRFNSLECRQPLLAIAKHFIWHLFHHERKEQCEDCHQQPTGVRY